MKKQLAISMQHMPSWKADSAYVIKKSHAPLKI
jgi:hypothetical protein